MDTNILLDQIKAYAALLTANAEALSERFAALETEHQTLRARQASLESQVMQLTRENQRTAWENVKYLFDGEDFDPVA